MLALTLAACSAIPVREVSENIPATDAKGNVAPDRPLKLIGPLKVLSLNLAHGRKDGANQLFLDKQTIRANLQEVAALLKKSDADIVALQESDGPSRWSGNFNHVAFLARQAGYPWYLRTGQAHNWLFDYGTSLLSRVPFIESRHHAFPPTPPTTTKGFSLGQVAWQPAPDSDETILLDVVSVHLDFSRATIREKQITEMKKILAGRHNPMIIMGDFNADWFSDEQVIQTLATKAGLHTYRPQARDLGTYRSGKKRLDWILISRELAFRNYAALPEVVSDHYPVVAEIVYAVPATERSR